MELRDARKINSKELYDRRKQAVLLFEKGLKRYEIAPLVGVSAYTVGQWIKAWKKGGQACTLDSTSGTNSDQAEIFCGFELAGG